MYNEYSHIICGKYYHLKLFLNKVIVAHSNNFLFINFYKIFKEKIYLYKTLEVNRTLNLRSEIRCGLTPPSKKT